MPIVSAFYATAVMLGVPIATLWPAALLILLSMVPGAAYVSVINDLTDREEDLAAGKANRLVGKSRLAVAAILAVTIGAGLIFAWRWRGDVLLLSLYLAAWLAFSLYSLPPFRFKARGILGVLCDASGAHLFPTTVAVVLTFREAQRPVSVVWMISIAVWAFSYGLRGILWHQLTDRDADRSSGVRTFAQRHPPHVAMRLGTYVAFPLELLAITAILIQLRSVWVLAALLVYAIASWRRMAIWEMNVVVVEPKPRFFIVLHEYYDVFFPLALLVTAALRDRRDLIVLAVHPVLFPARIVQTLRDLRRLSRSTRPLRERYPAIARVDLPRGAVVFDVGAHTGYFTESVLAYQPRAKVFAFEPEAEAFATLVERHPRIVAENGVPALSEYVKERGIRSIDLLGIDLPGRELEVLSGAEGILDRVRWIYTEAALAADDMARFLHTRGFTLVHQGDDRDRRGLLFQKPA